MEQLTHDNTNLMSLEQVARYLSLSYSNVSKVWPSWKQWGVESYRFGNRLRFKKEHIDKMIKAHRVN